MFCCFGEGPGDFWGRSPEKYPTFPGEYASQPLRNHFFRGRSRHFQETFPRREN